MYGELKRGIHLDFHTLPGVEDFAAEFDAEKFAQTLEEAGVRYVNAFAKCNLGFCYYDTKIGVKYDPLPQDMLGGMITACHARDIGVTAYLNFGLDHEICRRHRDFCKVFSDGRVMGEYRVGNGFRAPCVNTGYGEYIYALVDELLTLYPELDGIFLDCISFTPCYGNECLEAIRAAGGNPLDPAAVARHTRDTTMALLEKIKARVGERNFICNSQPYHVMRHLNSHIEVECLPGGSWGYDFFPANAAYARTLSPRVMYMSGRFQGGWGDFGGLKSEASMENDLYDALSQGFSFSVGDHMHPRGALDPAVYAQIGRVFAKCRDYEPYLEGAHYKAEIGIVSPLSEEGFMRGGMAGAARMLSELKYGFDVVDEEMDFSPYRLLILPEHLRLSPLLKEKITAFLKTGKSVLSAGLGGLTEDGRSFALPEWRFTVKERLGEEKLPYYRAAGEAFLTAAYFGGILFDGEADEVYAEAYPAYFDRVYDGFHGYAYLPPRTEPVGLAAARCGRVAHIGFSVFEAYNKYAYAKHKALLSRVLGDLLPDPLIRTDLPSTARVTLTEKENALFCHVKVTYPEARGEAGVIEEHTRYPAGASVSILGEYAKARLLPANESLPCRAENGRTRLTLPEVNGYLCIALAK